MIKRIVKLTFKEDKIDEFLKKFDLNKNKIRNFEGCHHLELWKDSHKSNIFFTYSYWENEDTLNAYRHSELFRGIWSKTKVLFSDKPQAWSIDVIWTEENI